jgi:hypothetical protein
MENPGSQVTLKVIPPGQWEHGEQVRLEHLDFDVIALSFFVDDIPLIEDSFQFEDQTPDNDILHAGQLQARAGQGCVHIPEDGLDGDAITFQTHG